MTPQPLLAALLALATAGLHAQTPDRPQLLQQQSGTVTRLKMEGSLAATRDLGCLPAEKLEKAFTPPDLHAGVLKCLEQDRVDDAFVMFMMAGMYARFDALRIADPSVRGGPQAMIMNTYGSLPPEKREQFGKQLVPKSSDPASLRAACAVLQKVGPPSYFPRYLILHGMKAYTSPNPFTEAMQPNFDAPGTWDKLMTEYMHCEK